MTARLTSAPPTRIGRRARREIVGYLVAYNLMLAGLFPVLVFWLAWRALVRRKPMGSWRHRFGLVPRIAARARPRIWLHAVSAGEMMAARPVLRALRDAFPAAAIVVSTITPAGMAVAGRNCREADALFYLPFDWPDTMALALWRVQPDLLVLAEKELWPNLLGLARLLGARVLLVNGRVSHRMVRRSRALPGFARWLHRLPDFHCVQSDEDARRLAALGVPPECVAVTGNTKVDAMAERDPEAERRLRRDLDVSPGDVWLVAGSTHPGEEEAVVEAFGLIRARLPSARLLVAPRHLERVPAVSAALAQRGLSVVRRSEGPGSPEAAVVLDTMGELSSAYALATAAFVGGTLVPIGGHNLLEPVAAGKPVLFGPHTEACADVADLVLAAGVGLPITGARDLADRFLEIEAHPDLRRRIADRAAALIAQQRGAASRCAAVARKLLAAGGIR